jgi:hypothetical protein
MKSKWVSDRSGVSDTTWKVAELEHTICELEHAASELDRHIESEEARTRIYDPTHFAYSTFAKSGRERRARLRATIRRLKVELEAARREPRDAAHGARTAGLLSTSLDF